MMIYFYPVQNPRVSSQFVTKIFFLLPKFRRTYLEEFLSDPGFLADLGFSDQVLHQSIVVSEREGGGGRVGGPYYCDHFDFFKN